MSYFIDVGEQDKALAEQIANDQETLAAIHQTVADTRDRTDVLRQETAAQKRALDASLEELKAAKAELEKLEKRDPAEPARPAGDRTPQIVRNKANAARAISGRRRGPADSSPPRSTSSSASRSEPGNIPSEYNGTLAGRWRATSRQNFGCTGFAWEPPQGGCAHFHNGIDIVAPHGHAVRASGDGTSSSTSAGTTPTAPTRPGSSIIAHSTNLQTWYAHMQPA